MEKRTSTITIIGIPNSGKSTLINNIVGYKVSIVTPKVQTTRNVINGITIFKNTQLIFLDTPGIFNPKNRLSKFMVKSSWASIKNSDFILMLLDGTKVEASLNLLSKTIEKLSDTVKLVSCINKIDIVSQKKILDLKKNIEIQSCNKVCNNIFSISALKSENIKPMLDYFVKNSTTEGWYYAADQITTAPVRFLAEEITRESLFFALRQELPYSLTVTTEEFKETEAKIIIRHKVIVEKESHKKIIIGNKGETLKKIGTNARLNIMKQFEKNVDLFLFIQVRANWTDKENYVSMIRNFIT